MKQPVNNWIALKRSLEPLEKENQMDKTKKPIILIVDDAPENIHMLMELLSDEYDLIPAKSGEIALKRAKSNPGPDLILLDIIMPQMDGYQVCEQLKQNEKTKDIPVIYITAISEAMDEARAFKLGAVDYITKPFNPPTVRARVKTHIEHNQTLIELKKALKEIKTLTGLLPICSLCKKIRDDKGYWRQLESYISDRSNATFTHGICPECARKHYPEIDDEAD